LPYHFNQQTVENKTTSVKGLGDILVLANYNLLNNTDSLYQKVKHNLWLGGGVKVASGSYDKTIEGAEINPNLQLGSGSFDFVANAIYTIRYDKIGLNTNLTYKYNTANKNRFLFGNKFGATSSLFSVIKVKESVLMPNAGFSTEITAKDQQYGKEITESGGHINFLNLGAEFYYRNIALGGSFQKPVSQHISDGFVETGNRFLTHLTFMF